jgi:hypothetical protein
MAVISDAIIGGIAWEAFSKSLSFYTEEANNFVLRVYITQQLKTLEQLDGALLKQIEDMTDIIEATIKETPKEIKEIANDKEKEEAFKEYVKKNKYINSGTIQGIQHNEGKVDMHFGDVHNHSI